MSSHDHPHEHHVTSLATLWGTFAALVALTILTSALATFNFGRADIWITLGIALVKSTLVALIFMHLVHDKAFNGVILLATLLFVVLFIGFTLMDSGQYQNQIESFNADQRQKQVELESP